MSRLPSLMTQFLGAGVIALQLSQPAAAQDAPPVENLPLLLVPFEKLMQQFSFPNFTVPATGRPDTLRDTALEIGALYQARVTQQGTSVEIEMKIRDLVGSLQQGLIDYSRQRPAYYFAALDGEEDDIAVTGEFDSLTASLFIQMATMEDMKVIFLDILEVQNPDTSTAYRFLRNELKRLAPDEYTTGLATIAGNSERQAQEMQEHAFIECVVGDRRLFSPDTITEEMIKVLDNDQYFTRLLGGGCSYYLRGMKEERADSLQISFLQARIDSNQEPDEREWCAVFAPETFTGMQLCLIPKA